MPTSYSENIPKIIDIIKEIQPKKVLDIGIGEGKFGLLIKEYLSNDVIVDGVEVYKPYITGIHRAIYRKIYNQDITKMDLRKLEKYDLYLMIDIAEHLQKVTCHRILKELNGVVLISTPIEDYRAHYENHFEDHVSHWTLEDFSRYEFKNYSTELSVIVLIDTAAEPVNEVKRLRLELDNVYKSRSWRLTRSLREIKKRLHK